MRSAVFITRMVRVLVLAIPCLFPLLAGCDLEPYPPDLTYPLRSDPIVTAPPPSTIWDTFGPGQLEHHIATLSQIGGKTLDPAKLPGQQRGQLQAALNEIFGTPAEPKVHLKDADEEFKDNIKFLKLDADTLKLGSKVYRRHCMHCHGVTGDGRGPTGPWVNPTPRDYRQGLFKFISTDVTVGDRKPRREDIRRTLEHGIEGTSMPSFSLLEEKEKQQLISYVMHLSLRGEVERFTMEPILDDSLVVPVRDKVVENLTGFLQAWADSNKKNGIEPAPYPYKEGKSKEAHEQLQASIRRGYELFTDPKGDASCIACHLDFGRQAPFRYDKWGTLVRPANLTAGVYRGGRRPLDLYWRIRGGIDPSQMPRADLKAANAGKDKGGQTEPYWDLVNFIQALPYPKMLPDDISHEIYGRREKSAEHARR